MGRSSGRLSLSLHTEQPGKAQGNLDGAMVVPLLIGVPDDVRRLALIARETAYRRKKHRPPGGMLFGSIPIQRVALRLAPHQRVMNTYAANVPGPPMPLYFAGEVLELFPVAPPGQRVYRCGCAVLRGTVQRHRRRRPGDLPGSRNLRRRHASFAGRPRGFGTERFPVQLEWLTPTSAVESP